MNELFCTYEQSIKLKELGFDEPCFAKYSLGLEKDNFTQLQFHIDYNQSYSIGHFIPIEDNFMAITKKNSDYGHAPCAPLKHQVLNWFRTKYQIYPEITLHNKENTQSWIFIIHIIGFHEIPYHQKNSTDPYYKTYEEAEHNCINKLIELVK